jgi:DNA-binding MarR family transcriptional regulator
VLVSISYLEQPVRITDIALWLERSANSISMIIDRMVKAGLVKRARDEVDRTKTDLRF